MARRRILSVGGAVACVLVYVLLLYWFDSRDFYHKHFFDHGLPVRHYERLRLLFIFCLAWLVYAPGAMVLSTFGNADSSARLPAWERYPLGFLIGVAIWSMLLYAIGLAGFYQKPIAVGITVAVALASIPHLAACIEQAASAFARFRASSSSRVIPTIGRDRTTSVDHATSSFLHASPSLPRAFVLIAIVLAAAAFLLVKGLYPGGGHDYYNHYFPYYMRVIQTGSILPNDVWYHFYVSKGDGLYFLAMLLTDPLAPQLVTVGFILCAACIVYAMLRRISPSGLLPWIGVLLYFAFFIYTPGPLEFKAQGGWGDLEKEHELTAVLLLGVIWCVIRLFGASDADRRPWLLGLHASIVATIIITLQLGFLIGFYLTAFMLWFVLRRQWRQARTAFFGCITAAATIIVIFAINYELTGVILDQAILFTWPIADLRTLAHWGALFEAIRLDQGMKSYSANAAPWSRTILWLLPCYLRLEIWGPLVAIAGLFAVYRLVRSRASKVPVDSSVAPAVWTLLCFAGAVAIVAMFGGGRSQSVTFYRISSFSYAPTLCLGLALWHYGIGEFAGRRASLKKVVASGLIGVLLIGIVIHVHRIGKLATIEYNVRNILLNAGAFWSGRFSLADAYRNQQGWPGRLPWGGIYPALEPVWRMLPPFTRVWSFHIWTYCMLPDCNVQGVMSFIFSPQWRTVYFGTPERARAVLQAEGLDYFFFSKAMPIEDSIGHAPLFSPDEIGKYLAVRWTDGTNYLLTWPGPDTRPLDESFLSAYRDLTQKSGLYKAFDVTAWRAVADQIAAQEAAGEKLHPFRLPWCQSVTWCFGGS